MQEMQEERIRFRSLEDPLEEEMATHSSVLVWKIPWTEELGGLQSKGWPRVRTEYTYTLTVILISVNFFHFPSSKLCILFLCKNDNYQKK